jgi:hypothetical protein
VLPWRGRNAWRLLDLDEAGPLADLAGDTFSVGFSGAGEAMRALSTLAAQEVRPVADALVSSPAGWWQPVARTDQRLPEQHGWPMLLVDDAAGLPVRVIAMAARKLATVMALSAVLVAVPGHAGRMAVSEALGQHRSRRDGGGGTTFLARVRPGGPACARRCSRRSSAKTRAPGPGLGAVPDGPDVQVVAEAAEGTLDVGEGFVGGDDLAGVQPVGRTLVRST